MGGDTKKTSLIFFNLPFMITKQTGQRRINRHNMKQLTLNINDNKFRTFLEFVKTLDYVEVQETDNSYIELQNSLNQVKMMQEGQIKKQSANEFLNEL